MTAKRKANSGSLRKGHDPRGHRLTTQERRRGFLTLVRVARGAAVSKKARQAQYVLDCLAASGLRANRGWPGDEEGVPF